MPHHKTRDLIGSLLLLCAGGVQAATSIQSFDPAVNDRFANDPAFIGASYDFSGVGRDSNGHWATLLSPTVFLSANHLAPTGTLYFRSGNDPNTIPVTSVISSATQIGNTDLYIGTLATAVPNTITSYSFVTVPLTSANFGSSSLFNVPVFMGGISPTTTGYGTAVPDITDQTVGTNRLEGFAENITAGGTGGAVGDVLVTVRNLPGDGAFGYAPTTYEAQLAAGDSGSPLFTFSGGNLVVAGIALAISDTPTDIDPGPGVAPRDFSAFSYTGSSAQQIQNYLDTGSVPEPSGAALLALAVAAGCCRRKI